MSPSLQSDLEESVMLFQPVADAPEIVTSAPVTSAPQLAWRPGYCEQGVPDW